MGLFAAVGFVITIVGSRQFSRGRNTLLRVVSVFLLFAVLTVIAGSFDRLIPGVAGADKRFVAEPYCQVVYPTGGAAGFHNDEIARVLFEEGLKVVTIGGSVKKGRSTGF